MKRKLVLVGILVLACIFLSSCSGGTTQKEDFSKSIVGAWSQDRNASNFTTADGKTITPMQFHRSSFLFNDTGMVDYGDISLASYAINGASLSLQIPYSSMESYTIMSISNTEMILQCERTISLDGQTVTGVYNLSYKRQ